MDKRWLVFFLVVLGISLFFQTYILPPPQRSQTPASAPAESATQPFASADVAEEETPPTSPAATEPIEEPGEIIALDTDSYSVKFNTRGAVPVSWVITDEDYQLHNGAESDGIEMIPDLPGAVDREYPLHFILKEAQTARGFFDQFNRRNYEVQQSKDAQGNYVVTFTSPVLPEGLQLIKTFTLPTRGFLSKFKVQIVNHSNQQMQFADGQLGPGTGWGPGIGGDEKAAGGFGVPQTPESAVWFADGDTVDIKQNDIDIGQTTLYEMPVEWTGLTNRYFFTTLIPKEPTAGLRVSMKSSNLPADSTEKQGPMTVDVFQKPLTLSPGQAQTYEYDVFVGPKSKRILWDIGHNLDEIFFFDSWRWFRALCLMLMWGLIHLRDLLPSYGWAIIGLTLILRLITQPFVYYSQKSGARFSQAQKRLKPELDEIMKKFKDNPQKRNEETWKLYKKHNVNPLGAMKGCLWAIIQMPFFFAFYRLLLMSIELRGASFLWIDDLSQPDQLFMLPAWVPFITAFNLLPILMTATQYFTQKLTMTSATDPMQKQMMVMMPVFFMFIMYNMSSGLVLYWFVSNLWQIGSQLWINKIVRKEEVEHVPHAGAVLPATPTAPTEEDKQKRKPRGAR